jgi:hypothetical protein
MISVPIEIFVNMISGDFDGDGADEAAVDSDQACFAETDGSAGKELTVDFGATGLWLWNGGTWNQISTADPD